MKLYEATNGRIGDKVGHSYSRCYVVALDQGAAVALAMDAFSAVGQPHELKRIKIRELLDIDNLQQDKEFATKVSDTGWE